jgi:hypothetical protein
MIYFVIMCEVIYICIYRDIYLHNYFNLVDILIKHLMEEEGGAKVGYYLEMHFSNEAFGTLKFLPIVVV